MAGYNGCPYTGNIFTFKNRVTMHVIIFTLKSMIVPFSYSISGFFYDMNFPFFLHKNNYNPFNVSLSFHCFSFLYLCPNFSPAAPSAALAAPERPSLATVVTPVAAARVAAHWRPSPLVVVVV